MLTGDHPATGVAIARQIGILDRDAAKEAVFVRPLWIVTSHSD